MNIFQFVKQVLKLIGNTNVQYTSRYNPVLISKVNRKDLVNNYIIFMIILVIVLFCFSFLVFQNRISDIGYILYFLLGICFVLSISLMIRLKEGDTIIVSNEGIEEINWLFSKFIGRDEIAKIYIYAEGILSRKYSQLLKVLGVHWTCITIKGKHKAITINTRFSDIENLREYILLKWPEKIENRKVEPIYKWLTLILVGLIMLIFTIFYPFRSLLKTTVFNILRSFGFL